LLTSPSAHAAGLAEPPAPEAFEEVVVEEDAGPDPSRTPASVTVLPIDERLPASSDVASVVDSAAGASVRHLGGLGDWSAVSIRGSSLRQVQIYLDGVPLNPDGASTVNLAELPLSAFSRIEVYRGSAPPELGAAAIGGVVNLVTRESAAPASGVSGTYGSHRTSRISASTQVPGRALGAPVDTLVVAELFGTRGDFTYFNDNATVYDLFDDHVRVRGNNDKTQLSAHGRVRVGDRRLRLTVLDAFLSREEGLPGPWSRPAQDARLATTRELAAAEIDGGGDRLRGRVRAWGQVREEIFDDRAGEIGISTQWTRDVVGTWGTVADGRWRAAEWVVPHVAFEGRRESYSSHDQLLQIDADPRFRTAWTGSLSATFRAPRDLLVVTPVVQGRWIDNRALGDEAFTNLSEEPDTEGVTISVDPRVGVLVGPAPWLAVKANLGRYLRTPDLTELFGDRGGFVGNADLLPERGLQWDLGARAVLPENPVAVGSLEVAAFWNSVRDAIVYVQNSQQTLVPVNLGRTWVQGVEVAASADVVGAFEVTGSLTRNVSVNLSTDPAFGNNALPRVPGWEVEARSSVRWGERIRIGHTLSFTAANYWDATNWYLAAPRTLHGLFARVKPGEGAPEIELDVLNVADRIVQVVPRNPLDSTDMTRVVQPLTDFSGYPLPGRTFLITVRWNR
jgi:iron complex outermembrane receptor protein